MCLCTELMMQRIGEDANAAPDTEAVQLIEEVARIEKREAVTGRVRVASVTDTIEDVIKETLKSDRVIVERVSVDRVISEVPATRIENGVTIIPIVEEVLFVEKRLVLKEELHVRHETDHESVEMPVTLKKQRAVIERLNASDSEKEE